MRTAMGRKAALCPGKSTAEPGGKPFHVHTRHKLSLLKKKKKKKKRHTLFYAGKGFLKEAMQASCFWTSTRNHYRSTTPFDSN